MYSRSTIYATAFLRRYLPYVAGWSLDSARQWVKWFMCHGRALMVYDRRRLVGVALVRLVDTPEQAQEPYKDTGGRVAYVEATACRDGTMRHLVVHGIRAFPSVDTMTWVRSKYRNRPITIPVTRALSHLT